MDTSTPIIPYWSTLSTHWIMDTSTPIIPYWSTLNTHWIMDTSTPIIPYWSTLNTHWIMDKSTPIIPYWSTLNTHWIMDTSTPIIPYWSSLNTHWIMDIVKCVWPIVFNENVSKFIHLITLLHFYMYLWQKIIHNPNFAEYLGALLKRPIRVTKTCVPTPSSTLIDMRYLMILYLQISRCSYIVNR